MKGRGKNNKPGETDRMSEAETFLRTVVQEQTKKKLWMKERLPSELRNCGCVTVVEASDWALEEGVERMRARAVLRFRLSCPSAAAPLREMTEACRSARAAGAGSGAAESTEGCNLSSCTTLANPMPLGVGNLRRPPLWTAVAEVMARVKGAREPFDSVSAALLAVRPLRASVVGDFLLPWGVDKCWSCVGERRRSSETLRRC